MSRKREKEKLAKILEQYLEVKVNIKNAYQVTEKICLIQMEEEQDKTVSHAK